MIRNIQWPNGALVCCTFRVAYEAFSKSGKFKKTAKIPLNLASLSHANYGGRVGIWRLMEIFERTGIKATIGANGLAVEKWPETIKAAHAAGHEICAHGMTNDYHMTDLNTDQQRKEFRDCIDAIKKVTGVRPIGWAGPGNLHTEETLGILADEGYLWFGDVFDDDIPYVVEINKKRICCIPKLNYANDWRAWSDGLGHSGDFFEGFKRAFDSIYQEALRGRPGHTDVITHAELGGRHQIAPGFEDMIRYVKQYGDQVWIPTRTELADYLLKTLPSETYKPFG